MDYRLSGFKFKGKFYFDMCLPMGKYFTHQAHYGWHYLFWQDHFRLPCIFGQVFKSALYWIFPSSTSKRLYLFPKWSFTELK